LRTIDVPVLIVGGGGAGLTASNLLGGLGVESLLVERHAGTTHLPKAHYINQRSMEIYREAGLSEAMYAVGPTAQQMSKVIWHTSLGGDGPVEGLVIHEEDAMGGGRYQAEYEHKGTTRPLNLPLLRLEPLLREFAEKRNPGQVLFGHECVSVKESGERIEALIIERDSAAEFVVRAKYVIGADAGKTVGPAVGVNVTGVTGLGDYVGVYFKADLSRYIPDERAVMRIVMHPDGRAGAGVGGLLALGPRYWDRRSEEWALGWGYALGDPERNREEGMAERVQKFLGVDVPVEIKRISHWQLEAVIADKFRVGRAFLIGDAAHRHTPGAGLGLNSGIQDAHNLCWKLMLVLEGKASESLLDSYEPERRPVIVRNIDQSLLAFANYHTALSSMGVIVGAPAEQNKQAIAMLVSDTPEGATRRARMRANFRATMGLEYGAYDLEMGAQYQSGAVIDDGTPFAPRDPLGMVYHPSAHPGCRLPHVWVRKDGKAVSTHDLVPAGGFALIAGENGQPWCSAAQRIAAANGVSIQAWRIGKDCEISDPSGEWQKVRSIDDDGALLVRPDRYVGYRARTAVSNIPGTLEQAVTKLLGGRASPQNQTGSKIEPKGMRCLGK
jgi:2,4-dichlorophenol 6-monooxygenase